MHRSTGRGRSLRYAATALVLLVLAGCSSSHAAPAPGGRADRAGGAVTSYADASPAVRAVLDKSGLEPVVERAGARLAVGRHVVVAGDVDDSSLSEIAAIGDHGVALVDRMDGRSLDGRVLILAPRTAAEFGAWSGGGRSDDWGLTRPPQWRGDQSVITLDLAQHGLGAATLKEDGNLLRHVVAHEMFHALTLPVGEHAPLWLQEGFAEVAGERMRDIPHTEVPWRAALPTDQQFQAHPDDAYFLAWQLAAWLCRHEGQQRAIGFYLAGVSARGHTTLNELSRRIFHTPLPALVRRWEHGYDVGGPDGV